MKYKMLNIILVSVILLSALDFLHITPIEVGKVYANPGAPYTIIKNPYLNDTNYWIPRTTNNPSPTSYAIMNSSGLYLHCEKTGTDWDRWYQPWGVSECYQGLQFHNGLNYDLGKGLNYYIYIPSDIPDGQIILNVTVTRMETPSTSMQIPGAYNPLLAPGSLTHFGVGFWYAMKVKFWNDTSVPGYLRNKEVYLGWLSPEMWSDPNMFIQEFFLDCRIDWVSQNIYTVVSKQDGNDNLLTAFPGFLGSSQDWDWHSNLILNHTDLNTPTTFTIDLGKYLKEFVNFFQHRFDPDKIAVFGGFPRILTGYGTWTANVGNPSYNPTPYDVVGFTLIAVAPTMEVVNSKMTAKYSWFQIYDYRDNGGEPVTDPDFWKSVDTWRWLYNNGFPDPFGENPFNIIPLDFASHIMNIELGQRFTPYSLTPITDGTGGGFGIVRSYQNYNFNLTAIGVWGKAGVEHLFKEGYNNFTLPDEECQIKIDIVALTGYLYHKGATWANAGFYFDYEWGKDTTTLATGEIVCYDYPQESPYDLRQIWTDNITLTFMKQSGHGYWFKLTPHIECWWTDYFYVTGWIQVGFEWNKQYSFNYTVNIAVNNQSYGSVSPSPGTYTYQAGTNISLSATANSGYYFDHWDVRNDLKGINVNYTMNPLNLTVNIDYNVTAYFTSSPPSPPSNYILGISLRYYTSLYPKSIVLETLNPLPTLLHNESSNWITGDGTWSYPSGSKVNLAITNDQGWYFYYWFDGAKVTQKNWTTTLNSDEHWGAAFVPPYQWITVEDANSGAELSGFTIYYGFSSWYIDGSGCYVIGNYKTYSLGISKSGYYDATVSVKPEQGSNVIYLTPIQYSGGGGGGGRPPLMMSKLFSYTLTILNATQNVYRTWDNLLEVYPIYGTKATLTLTVHYNSTHPIIEIEAENIAMIKWNFTDIYHKLGCVYFNRVPILTKFYGLRIESNSSLILDFGLPSKPGELWKLLPGQELPGTMLTNWKWQDGRVLLAFEPGDPTVSILLQTAMQQTQDVVLQFMMIIVTLVMVLAVFKFIRDKF